MYGGKPQMSNKNLKPVLYVAGITAVLLMAVIFFTVLLIFLLPEPRSSEAITGGISSGNVTGGILGFRELFQLINFLLTSVNILLLAYLLYNYVSVYLQVKSNFSLGLIVLASALLAHSISANPVIAMLFGFRGTGLGPFTIIPSFFTLIAAIVLVHLSKQ